MLLWLIASHALLRGLAGHGANGELMRCYQNLSGVHFQRVVADAPPDDASYSIDYHIQPACLPLQLRQRISLTHTARVSLPPS